MSGEQKTFDDSTPIGPKGLLKHKPLTAFDIVKDAIQEGKRAGRQSKVKDLKSENAALKESLAELIPIASKARGIEFPGEEFLKAVKAIDRAKKLLNKQTQSESDKTE